MRHRSADPHSIRFTPARCVGEELPDADQRRISRGLIGSGGGRRNLRAGGSDYPMNLLKRAGVDLGTPAPAEAVVAQLDKRVSQLEAEIAKLV